MQLAHSILAITLIAAPVSAKEPINIGGEPEWVPAKAAAIALIKSDGGLLDPYSARFQFRNEGIVRTNKGWLVCGRVNAKNQYGGYAGYSSFWVRIVQGRIERFNILPQGLGWNACDIKTGFTDESSS